MVGITIGMAPSAQAAPGCFTGRICLWDGANFGGTVFSYTLPTFGCVEIQSSFDNMASSYYNHSLLMAELYNGDNCSGTLLHYMYPGVYANLPAGSNNTAESFKVYP